MAAAFVAFVALAWALAARPPPIPEARTHAAPLNEFSAARAAEHLRVLSAAPRRMGSRHHAVSQRYIVSELERLGLEVEVQRRAVLSGHFVEDGLPARIGYVENIVAKSRAESVPTGASGLHDVPATEGAILLMAHYDTRSMTPGASDDGLGVVTLLETARALAHRSPPLRDVIFLFTDGEEIGLLGARAFEAEHRWARDVALVMNFEARGNAGPVQLFQTSARNRELVSEALQAAPFPHATSLAQSVYERFPNDTDLSVWLPRGVPALNFANVAGLTRYHAATDTAAALDLDTLEHHGSYADALTRHFANRLDLPVASDDATFFVALGRRFSYPMGAALPLGLLACVLVVSFAGLPSRRGQSRPLACAASLLVACTATAAASLAAGLAARGLTAITPALAMVTVASERAQTSLAVASATVGVAAASSVYAAVAPRFRPAELAFGALLMLGAISVTLATALPGGAYLTTWPALAGALAWTVEADPLAWHPGARVRAALGLSLHAAALGVLFALLGPLVGDTRDAFGGCFAAPAIGLIVGLVVASVAGITHVALSAWRWHVAAGFATAAVVSSAVTLATDPFTGEHPEPHTLFAVVDHDAGTTVWASPDEPRDPWIAQALPAPQKTTLPDVFPYVQFAPWEPPLFATTLPLFVQRTIPAALEPPRVVAVPVDDGDERDADRNTGRDGRAERERVLRVEIPEGTELVALYTDGSVLRLAVDGKSVPLRADGRVAVQIWAPPQALDVRIAAERAIGLRVVGQKRGFPAELSGTLPPRPATLMPKPGTLPPRDEMLESDMTVFVRRFSF
jgi:hypothetical protein